jgi:hypothetical protein
VSGALVAAMLAACVAGVAVSGQDAQLVAAVARAEPDAWIAAFLCGGEALGLLVAAPRSEDGQLHIFPAADEVEAALRLARGARGARVFRADSPATAAREARELGVRYDRVVACAPAREAATNDALVKLLRPGGRVAIPSPRVDDGRVALFSLALAPNASWREEGEWRAAAASAEWEAAPRAAAADGPSLHLVSPRGACRRPVHCAHHAEAPRPPRLPKPASSSATASAAAGAAATVRQQLPVDWRERLEAAYAGHEAVVRHLSERVVQRCMVNGFCRTRTQAVFVFGPSGTGKSYLARATADALGLPLIVVALNTFIEESSVSVLRGANPGYVGHGRTPQWQQLQERGEGGGAVILLDELEKAHPAVKNFFLGVFDDGELALTDGSRVSFRHSLFIITSNAAADLVVSDDMNSSHAGFPRPIGEAVLQGIGDAALAARITAFYALAPYTPEDIVRVARLELHCAALTWCERGKPELWWHPDVPPRLALAFRHARPANAGAAVNVRDLSKWLDDLSYSWAERADAARAGAADSALVLPRRGAETALHFFFGDASRADVTVSGGGGGGVGGGDGWEGIAGEGGDGGGGSQGPAAFAAPPATAAAPAPAPALAPSTAPVAQARTLPELARALRLWLVHLLSPEAAALLRASASGSAAQALDAARQTAGAASSATEKAAALALSLVGSALLALAASYAVSALLGPTLASMASHSTLLGGVLVATWLMPAAREGADLFAAAASALGMQGLASVVRGVVLVAEVAWAARWWIVALVALALLAWLARRCERCVARLRRCCRPHQD